MKSLRLHLSVVLLFVCLPPFLSAQSSSAWPSLFDYVEDMGNVSFEEEGGNELDSAIFAMFSYIGFEGTAAESGKGGMCLRELSNRFFSSEFRYSLRNQNDVIWPSCLKMLEKAAQCKRYEDIKVRGYVNLVDESEPYQFSAIIFSISPLLHFVVFRGTDMSIAGWRDTFLMTCENQTVTQILSVNYLEEWASLLDGKIHVCGHSKGANLAIYASAQARPEVQERIETVWNFDGPGFSRNHDMLERIKAIDARIKTYVPETSLVGMLMRSFSSYAIVNSNNRLFLQHDLFSWQVDGNRFEKIEELSRTSRMFDSTMNATIANLSDAQFRIIINALFDSMEDAGIHNILDIGDNTGRFTASLAEACLFSGKETRRTLLYVSKCLAKNFKQARREEKNRR